MAGGSDGPFAAGRGPGPAPRHTAGRRHGGLGAGATARPRCRSGSSNCAGTSPAAAACSAAPAMAWWDLLLRWVRYGVLLLALAAAAGLLALGDRGRLPLGLFDLPAALLLAFVAVLL